MAFFIFYSLLTPNVNGSTENFPENTTEFAGRFSFVISLLSPNFSFIQNNQGF